LQQLSICFARVGSYEKWVSSNELVKKLADQQLLYLATEFGVIELS
jgi:hypothetical protein